MANSNCIPPEIQSSDLSVAVALTNYETWPLTSRCVERVQADPAGPSEIVVVDDGSSASPPAFTGEVAVLRNETNQGLVRSLNRAVRATDSDIVVVFDSDAYPLAPFTDAVRQAFRAEPRLGVLGFHTLGSGGKPTGSSEPEPGAASLLLGQRLNRWWEAGVRTRGPLCVFTCAMAMRRATFDELNGFDEEFDWLDLDLDFCMRARRAGWLVEQSGALVAFHEGSGAPQQTHRRVLRFYRNRWRLLSKFGRLPFPRLSGALIGARILLELTALLTLGVFFFRDRAVRQDKILGRRAVLRWSLSPSARS
jgi:GT2 family glycosyltransferase